MAQRRNQGSRRPLCGGGRTPTSSPAELRRLEERHLALRTATAEWSMLLREMELNGESSDPRYETYFKAYLEARQKEKRADLELFNRRQGLLT